MHDIVFVEFVAETIIIIINAFWPKSSKITANRTQFNVLKLMQLSSIRTVYASSSLFFLNMQATETERLMA